MRINRVQAQNQNLQTNRKNQPKFEARLDRGGESLVDLATGILKKYDKNFLNELIELLSKNKELKKIRLFAGEKGGLEPRFAFNKGYFTDHSPRIVVEYIDPFKKTYDNRSIYLDEDTFTPTTLSDKIVSTLQEVNFAREQRLLKLYPQNPVFNLKNAYLEELKKSADESTIYGKGIEKIQTFLGLQTPKAILDVKWHAHKLWDAQASYWKELIPKAIASIKSMTIDDIPKLEKFLGRELPEDKQIDKINEVAESLGNTFKATKPETDELALKIMDFNPSFWLEQLDRM